MAKNIWKGSYYQRNDGSWRQRETGNTVVIYERKNGRKIKWVGVEKPKANVYGYDPHKNEAKRRVWATRVKKNNPLAKKPRGSHRRVYGRY